MKCHAVLCLPCFTLPSNMHHAIPFITCCTILYLAIPDHWIWWDMKAYRTIEHNIIPHIHTPRPHYCMAKQYDTTPQSKSTICAQRELRMGEYFCDSGNILCDTPCFTMYHTTPLPYHTMYRYHTMPNNSTPYHTTFPCQWQHFMWHPALSHHTHTHSLFSPIFFLEHHREYLLKLNGELFVPENVHYNTHCKIMVWALAMGSGHPQVLEEEKRRKNPVEQKVSGGRNGSNLV